MCWLILMLCADFKSNNRFQIQYFHKTGIARKRTGIVRINNFYIVKA